MTIRSERGAKDEKSGRGLLLAAFLVYMVVRLVASHQVELLEDHDSLGYLGDAAAWSELAPGRLSPDSTPFYPICTALLASIGLSLETAGRVASLLFSVGLFLAIAGIGRRIASPWATFLGLLALGFSPVLTGLAFAVLSEPSYIATVYLGFWLFWARQAAPTLPTAVALGVVFGAAFLNRTEGLLFIGLLPLLQGAHGLAVRPRAYGFARWLCWSAAYVLAFAAVAAPQVISVSAKLGSPAINGRQVWMAMMNHADGKSDDEKVYGLDHSAQQINLDYLQTHPEEVAALGSGGAGLTDTARVVLDNVRELLRKQLWILLGVPGLLFFGAGILSLASSRRSRFDLFLVVALIGAGLLGPLLYNVATRHIAIIAPIMLLVAGIGLAEAGRRIPGVSSPRAMTIAALALLAVWVAGWAPAYEPLLVAPPRYNKEYSPESLEQPARLVREAVVRGLRPPARICSRKGYLAYFAGGIRQPLPYTDHDGLRRYMTLNGSDFLFLNYAILRRFPLLETFAAGEAGPEFRLLYRGSGPTGEPLELYRFEPEVTTVR